ncbi:UDP-N-acetylmuramoyl-L-alanyl-D-glutamate--2,6-diaminopimelate ligase [Acidocella aquatica]|uniref:UDP-N-acetylmuramoyl-L-alanyl-D-glutamate--2,6-diaminopimelate ligase n=1 Tax=Acidocella aquatica TaxID=1922313 RepID=A0ABQ6A491_9PROT|nr:UDP-N-acetylmuramoyl-L-alanyl-D-glutamate--2,6-diaminopimelate ligase [Acidocella aquatica]
MNGVSGITADSRAVRPGFLFVALPGVKADGRRYIAEAVQRGAVAVLAPEGTSWPPGVPPRPLYCAAEPRARLAELAVELAGKMPERLVAVTGTNGKTSTVDFLRQILAAAGREAASLGTLGVIAPGVPVSGSLTTPDPVTLANTLAMLAARKFTDVALEASSHGIEQCRLDGLRFAAAGFTNLTRDHLDYHGSMDAYRAAKLRLFEVLLPRGAVAVAMADMEAQTLALLREIAARRGLEFRAVGVSRVEARPDGQVVHTQGRQVSLHLPGRFQADNAVLAAALAEAVGVAGAVEYLPQLQGVRGRLERALVLDNGAAAYVDYAHTPDAIARVLSALRPHAAGRLVIVFGAGGDRDAGKRPLMGEQAARLADVAIVTDDNPRSEDPALIRAAIMAACPGGIEIGDRREAIAAGLSALRAGDVLVVAGKGHEQGQIVQGEVIPFDDAAVIRALGAAPQTGTPL